MTSTGKANSPSGVGPNRAPAGSGGQSEPSLSDPEVILALADLIQDRNGEVVLFNDSQFNSLELSTDSALVDQGFVEHHVTAAGDDVSGFRFVSFDNGLKLFFDPNLRVTVRGSGR